jgi:hypothetical protein
LKSAGFLLALVALVAAAPATSATQWNSNSFRSPTGNIACRYNARGTAANTYDQVNCYTENDSYILSVQTDQRKASGAYVGVSGGPEPAWENRGMLKALYAWVSPNAPVLPYGSSWWNGGNRTSLRCSSRGTGITCKAYVGGSVHGFFISRYTYRVW